VPGSAEEEDAIEAVSVAVASDGGAAAGVGGSAGGPRGRKVTGGARLWGVGSDDFGRRRGGRGIRPGGACLAYRTILLSHCDGWVAHLEVRVGPAVVAKWAGILCSAPVPVDNLVHITHKPVLIHAHDKSIERYPYPNL
jgi:hypothetical protein